MSGKSAGQTGAECWYPEGEEVGFERLAAIMSTRYSDVEADYLIGDHSGDAYIVGPLSGPAVTITRAEGSWGWVAKCQGTILATGHTATGTALLCAVEIAYQWLSMGSVSL